MFRFMFEIESRLKNIESLLEKTMKLSELNLLITGLNAQVQKITNERDAERQQFVSDREALLNQIAALTNTDPEVPAEIADNANVLAGNVQTLDDRVAG